MKVYAIENHPNDSRVTIDPNGIVQCLSSRMGTGGNNTPFVLIKDNLPEIINSSGECVSSTLDASYYKGCGLRSGIEREFVMIRYFTRQSHSEFIEGTAASALKNRDYKDFTDIVEEEHMEEENKKYVLRRLTPTECLRLQGLPDWWVDGANGSDSAVYRMAGNGIAVPCACDVLGRIAEECRK